MKDDNHSREDHFISALSNEFIVQGGSASLVDPAHAVKEHVVDSAAGNNAGQPYKRLQIPDSDEPIMTTGRLNGIFKLLPYEAIIYLGPTPPLGDYFSFTPFLWDRQYGKKVKKGDWIFAALGDPLNCARIRTEGNGSPFQANTIIIFTADQRINERLRALARAAGFPDSMINTYVIPSKLLKMGLDPQDDSFLILVRAANIYDKDAADAYNGNDHYAGVFRIKPKAVPDQLYPFDTPAQRNRKAIPEESLVQTGKSLTQSLDDLEKAILAQTPHLQHLCYDSNRWFAESRDVLETTEPQLQLYHQFAAGEASDTPYLRSAMHGIPANFTLNNDEMVVVYGVNHQATGLATYSNFSVYGENILQQEGSNIYLFGHNDPIWCGVTGMGSKDSDDPHHGSNHFTGSARYFLPDDPNADYLYAVRVARHPPLQSLGQETPPEDVPPFVVVAEPTTEDGPASGIELDAPVTIGYRAYLNPATGSGPSYADIIPDRAIWFKLG